MKFNRKFLRRSVSAIVCLMLIIGLSACRNADFVGNFYGNDNRFTLDFKVLNVTKTKEFNLKSGDTVEFDVTKESGQIDISLGIEGATPDYNGVSVETGTFSVTVHEDGKYVLSVTGSKAKGRVIFTLPE